MHAGSVMYVLLIHPLALTPPPPCCFTNCRRIGGINRDAESLQVVQLYSCLDRIDHLEWSRNSMYVLCAQYSRAIIQVWAAGGAWE